MTMQFGIWLPSYTYRDGDPAHRTRLHEIIKIVEREGLDMWVIDHVLTATGLYGTSWLDPLTVLSYAAAMTEKARLGTAILVLPVRHPVTLAKQLASLDYLSNGRFIFGVGPGWYTPEYEATGSRIEERGARTDEIIAAVRLLLSGENVTFEGRYYSFKNVTIEPRPAVLPKLWVSGGSRLPDPEYHDVPAMAPSVLNRIAGADGWLARNSGTQEWVKRDWEQVRAEVIRRRGSLDGFTFGHVQFIHVVDADDREKALAQQYPSFQEVMGTHRSFEQLQDCYLLGTVDEQVARLRDLEEAGCQYVVLGPTTDNLDDLERLLDRVVRPFKSVTAGGR